MNTWKFVGNFFDDEKPFVRDLLTREELKRYIKLKLIKILFKLKIKLIDEQQ